MTLKESVLEGTVIYGTVFEFDDGISGTELGTAEIKGIVIGIDAEITADLLDEIDLVVGIVEGEIGSLVGEGCCQSVEP